MQTKRAIPLFHQLGLAVASRQFLQNGSMGSIFQDRKTVKAAGMPLSVNNNRCSNCHIAGSTNPASMQAPENMPVFRMHAMVRQGVRLRRYGVGAFIPTT